SCTVNNYTFDNGATYSVPKFYGCLQYKCVDGVPVLTKEGKKTFRKMTILSVS
ncbi:hypothetical protein BgiBS90_036076, partial [Biomphalaria glabrata]